MYKLFTGRICELDGYFLYVVQLAFYSFEVTVIFVGFQELECSAASSNRKNIRKVCKNVTIMLEIPSDVSRAVHCILQH